MIQITYQKRNGEIFQRYRTTYCTYRVGDTTSMGWKVLDIKHKWGNNYYNYNEYCKLVDQAFEKDKRRYKMKTTLKNVFRNINQTMTFLILFRLFIILSNKAILGINLFI